MCMVYSITPQSTPVSRVANSDPQAADREGRMQPESRGAGIPRVEDAYLRVLVGAIPRNDNTGGGVDISGRMRSQNDDTY